MDYSAIAYSNIARKLIQQKSKLENNEELSFFENTNQNILSSKLFKFWYCKALKKATTIKEWNDLMNTMMTAENCGTEHQLHFNLLRNRRIKKYDLYHITINSRPINGAAELYLINPKNN